MNNSDSNNNNQINSFLFQAAVKYDYGELDIHMRDFQLDQFTREGVFDRGHDFQTHSDNYDQIPNHQNDNIFSRKNSIYSYTEESIVNCEDNEDLYCHRSGTEEETSNALVSSICAEDDLGHTSTDRTGEGRGPYKKFSENEKQEILQYEKVFGEEKTVKFFTKVNIKSLRRWKEKEGKRRSGSGRKKTSDKIINVMIRLWKEKPKIKKRILIQETIEILKEQNLAYLIENFKFSDGFFHSLKKDFGICFNVSRIKSEIINRKKSVKRYLKDH